MGQKVHVDTNRQPREDSHKARTDQVWPCTTLKSEREWSIPSR